MSRPRDRRRATAADSASLPFQTRRADDPDERAPVETALFEATEVLLRDVSLNELRVEDILSAAGVSRTTFYHYFGSKHAVVAGMLVDLQAELVGVMRPWFQRKDRDPEEALREALTAVAELWELHRPTFRASAEHWHDVAEIGEPWAAMMAAFASDIAKQLRRERELGAAPRGADAQQLATSLTWSSEHLFYLAGWGMLGPRNERDAVEALLAMWLGTIYGAPLTPQQVE